MDNPKFTAETVLHITRHTPKLISFTVSRPPTYRFSAGQFSRLGFEDGNGLIWRAYSVLSPEYADHLEYFAVLIPGGPMSNRFRTMQLGDTVLLDKTATGFLLPERFSGGRDLVMLSTGSGIAPFLSQLGNPALWQRFSRLILVHCVARADELVFSTRINSLATHPLLQEYAGRLSYIPVTTRESGGASLHQRLPQLLQTHALAHAAGIGFSPQDTRWMICGNPAMVRDTLQTLLSQGFSLHRNRLPGHILVENGF